jgi:thiaminase
VNRQLAKSLDRSLLDTGAISSYLTLQMAFLPCLLGYGIIATRLHASPTTKRGVETNPYWKWIENYVADDYAEAMLAGRTILEKGATGLGMRELEELVKIFKKGCIMERRFWDMGLRGSAD